MAELACDLHDDCVADFIIGNVHSGQQFQVCALGMPQFAEAVVQAVDAATSGPEAAHEAPEAIPGPTPEEWASGPDSGAEGAQSDDQEQGAGAGTGHVSGAEAPENGNQAQTPDWEAGYPQVLPGRNGGRKSKAPKADPETTEETEAANVDG